MSESSDFPLGILPFITQATLIYFPEYSEREGYGLIVSGLHGIN